MTEVILLRKMNPRGSRGPHPKPSRVEENAWRSDASEGESVPTRSGRNGGEKHEQAKVGGGSSLGRRVGGAAGTGAGTCKERAATTGAKPFASSAGAVERHRAKADHHGGGFSG